MKKWIAILCAFVVAASCLAVYIHVNGRQQIDGLNQDLADREKEIESLTKQAETDAQTIQDLNGQVSEARETITVLTAENEGLKTEIETLQVNLSDSQVKLQTIMDIITGGSSETSASAVSFSDVPEDHPCYAAVSAMIARGLMAPVSEDVFGIDNPAEMAEWAKAVCALRGETLSGEEAIAVLSQSGLLPEADKQDVIPAEETEKAAETGETPAEEPAETIEAPVEEAAAETAESTEAPAEEATEAPVEEAAAETAESTEAPAEEATEAPVEEAVAEAAESTDVPAEETAKVPVEETVTEAAESVEVPAEGAEETPVGETAAEAADNTEDPAEEASEKQLLTRSTLLTSFQAFCAASGLEVPDVTLTSADAEYATRGDVALVLYALDQTLPSAE